VWGLALVYNVPVESVIPFFGGKKNKNVQKPLIYKEYTMHVLLGGDNEFLHTVCGLQSCSATNFCIHCEASLERLRKERDMSSVILRTRDSAMTQLVRVNEGTSKDKREELVKVNGSYIKPALIVTVYDRIFFPTIHVTIGIQNSLLENLTVRLRHHETACLYELSIFTEGRDNLLHHTAEVEQWRDFYDKDHKSAKQQRKEYYPLHISAANDKSISYTYRSELEKKYKGALVRKNAAEKIKKIQHPRPERVSGI
jgi:hypothetical protein